jgi:hypothetical protein
MDAAPYVCQRDDTTNVSTNFVLKGRNLVQEKIAVGWIGEGGIPLHIGQVLRIDHTVSKHEVAGLLGHRKHHAHTTNTITCDEYDQFVVR